MDNLRQLEDQVKEDDTEEGLAYQPLIRVYLEGQRAVLQEVDRSRLSF